MTDSRRPFAVSGAAQRLARHETILGLAVVAVMVLMVWVSIVSISGVPFSDPYRLEAVVPAGAPLMKDGDDVRVAGQRAGQVREVLPGPEGGTLIKMDLDEGTVGEDARARVRFRGLAGSVYLDITRGNTNRPLPSGARIPMSRTSSGVQLINVVAGFDRATRDAMSRSLERYGSGLAGQGSVVNALLDDLAPTSERLGPLMEAFAPEPGQLSGLLRATRLTMRGLAPAGSSDLGGLLASSAAVLAAVADRRDSLVAVIDRLSPFEDEALASLPLAHDTLVDAERAVTELQPGARELVAALPAVNRLLATRRPLASVGPLARAALPVVTAGIPLVGELRRPALTLSPLAVPLGPFSTYMASYRDDLYAAPEAFTRWGQHRYSFGMASGARAVRFAPVFTCQFGRNPYPDPGSAPRDRKACP